MRLVRSLALFVFATFVAIGCGGSGDGNGGDQGSAGQPKHPDLSFELEVTIGKAKETKEVLYEGKKVEIEIADGVRYVMEPGSR